MLKTLHAVLLSISLTAIACRDASAPITRSLEPAARHDVNPGYPVQEDYTTEELQHQQSLIWVQTQASAWFASGGYAYASGRSDFFANSADQSLELRLFQGASQTASTPPQTKTASGLSLFGSLGSVQDTTQIPNTVTCGLTATAYSTGHARYIVFNRGFSSLLTLTEKSSPANGNGYMNPCPPPKAVAVATYNGTSGQSITITLPPGNGASIDLASAGSGPGQSGGPTLASYQWKLAGSAVSSSQATSISLFSSANYSLTVTDQFGGTSTVSGSVTINPTDPCDDPFTEMIETDCDWRESGDRIAVGGSSEQPGENFGGGGNSTYVCYVTDWYEWRNGAWVYTGETTTNYCTFE